MTIPTATAVAFGPEARRAQRFATLATIAFGAGCVWLLAKGIDSPSAWQGLVVIAIAQIAFSLVSLGAARSARLTPTPVGASTWATSLTFGILGLCGLPFFIFIASFVSTRWGGSGGIGSFGAWGRPLRVRGKIVHPEIRASAEWAAGAAPDVSALDASARATLAAWWLRDAQKEHASVPAFAKLAWQLTALGAPAELLERTYRAGLEEIDHARRCFALVSAYRGEPCGVMAMPELAHDDAATDGVKLAVDSLVDGCFIEDLNSDAAELALERATDPAVRPLLETIVRDERAHAQLAWDIVAWCVREGGAPVERALRAAAARIPAQGGGLYDEALAKLVAGCAVADLHAHGRVPLEDWPALHAARLASTRARLEALLAKAA